jgi:hypothetical protein
MAARKTKKRWDSYEDYLKSPEWAVVRDDVIYRDGDTCQVCSQVGGELHCHHWIYPEDWSCDTPRNAVRICASCHSDIHGSEYKNSNASTYPEYLIGWIEIDRARDVERSMAEVLAQIIAAKRLCVTIQKMPIINGHLARGESCHCFNVGDIFSSESMSLLNSIIDIISEDYE